MKALSLALHQADLPITLLKSHRDNPVPNSYADLTPQCNEIPWLGGLT